ncbi:MAG: hypothetical protein JWM09_1196 [Francisellaceae bacterium]|nr:hypothetical protein [Francisellaceae bacterium]
MNGLSAYKNWILQRDEHNVATLIFNKFQSSMNTLSEEVLIELESIVESLQDTPARALIIGSGKKNGLGAGADIEEFAPITEEDKAYAVVKKGQDVMNEIASLPFPTLIIIKGVCFGGVLELALSCRYRICVDDPSTRLGLPEVKLGIHPGWGGTLRLPELIAIFKAMDLILSGQTVNAKTAYKLGLVDCAVPERNIKTAIQYYLDNVPKLKPRTPFYEPLFSFKIFRKIAATILRKKLSQMVREVHYPSPFKVIDNWEKLGSKLSSATLEQEAHSIASFVVSAKTKMLGRVFFLQEKLKKLSKALDFDLKHIHVLGAGVMGGDIAAWCALKGFKVSLQDQNLEAICRSLQRAKALFIKQLKEPHLVQAALDRLMPDPNGEGIAHAQIVIEAIVENLEAKQDAFKYLESKASSDAILATNTSTIPLEKISQIMTSPARLIGIHFFNPVAKMPLVEVVKENDTNPDVINKVFKFITQIDKLPLPVKSAPGFLVNRLLMPYMMESILLVEEGVPPEYVDEAALAFGMPMGPIELADTVGLDVALFAGRNLNKESDSVSEKLLALVEKGHLGKKTGRGFYQYKNGKAIKSKLSSKYLPPSDMTDRLFLRMINEAKACLRENIVSNSDYVDAGLIFGSGFAPFRGGPMQYIKNEGIEIIKLRLKALHERYGERFKLDKSWNHSE